MIHYIIKTYETRISSKYQMYAVGFLSLTPEMRKQN